LDQVKPDNAIVTKKNCKNYPTDDEYRL